MYISDSNYILLLLLYQLLYTNRMTDLDDYDFTPAAGSNLRSVFDNSMEPFEISTLHYIAPKQPKVGTTNSEIIKPGPSPKTETSVVCAKVVQVWKLSNANYTSVGKLGCAIIASSLYNAFELILYKEKRNIIMRVKISPSFEIISKQDNFASFYDTNQENWLIKFSNNEENKELVSFIEQYGGKIIQETKQSEATNLEKTNCLTENKARADILTRIAKMGQSILPSNNLDIEEETVNTTKPNKINENTQIASLAQTELVQNPQNTLVLSQRLPTFDSFSVLAAENRANSSEIKLTLSQITEKLNSVIKFVDGGKSGNESETEILKSRIKVLELRTENLLKEILDLQNENSQLEKGNKLEDENNLRKMNEEMNIKNFELQNQLTEFENQNRDLSNLVEAKDEEIKELKKKLQSYQSEATWKEEVPQLQEAIRNLEAKLKEAEKKQEMRKENKEKSEIFKTMLKEEMNGLYANLTETVNDSNIPVAKNIKQTTLKIIQNYQNLFEDFS